MGHAAVQLPMSAHGFLSWDATQTVRHEFVRGDVFAMTGVSDRHATAVGNQYIALRSHLRGSTYRMALDLPGDVLFADLEDPAPPAA